MNPNENAKYYDFLKQKRLRFESVGLQVDISDLNPVLFPFQAAITRWAIRGGRAAIFADTGLGKTAMQLEWARYIQKCTGKSILIIAPLSVARQTVNEGKKLLGLEVVYSRNGDVFPITITNYEMIDKFNPDDFIGVVLDESSILKSLAGKTRRKLTDLFRETPYKLCCTATPAPNDIAEICNHSEFLAIRTREDILSDFFTHDDNGYRLKHQASDAFYSWMASWSMAIKTPSNLGYSDEGYQLPPLEIKKKIIRTDYRPDNQLFFTKLQGIHDRSKVRKGTLKERCLAAAEMVNNSTGQWIIWCGLNDESSLMSKLISDAVEVKGSDKIDDKIASIEAFQDGKVRVLVTKPKIAGMGMNFQNSHMMAFVGLSDSWETYYQCIRRQYRYGQNYPVEVYIVLSDIEQEIYTNILRKEKEAAKMSEELIDKIKDFEKGNIDDIKQEWTYHENKVVGLNYTLILGDSCEKLKEIDEDSIDLSVFSPPFQDLYAYSPTERDVGNSATPEDFYQHFGLIIEQLYRITKPGRICAVHVMDIPAMLVRDGYIGIKDFSGDVIREYQKYGWIYDARIPIDKNQQAQSIRTHAKGLTFSQLERDRVWSRPALPDYILKFRKPGENAIPVKDGDIDRDLWIEWANPTWPDENDRCMEIGAFSTWYGISESDTLQGWRHIKEEAEHEKHICPLQLGTIERCIKLWSNKGETVLDPFSGIGSTVYQAVKYGRNGLGIELNKAWFKESTKQLKQLENEMNTVTLFDYAGIEV